MTFFEFLIVGHMVGDFLFQTAWMATKKDKNLAALFLHSAVYTFFIGLASALASHLSLPALAVVFLTHMFFDNRYFVSLWVKTINGSAHLEWLKIVVDQCWHLLVLSLVAYYF